MKGLVALPLALAPFLVLASAIPTDNNINIIFHVDKASGASSLDVQNGDDSVHFARSCSGPLASGAFENHAVSFAVDGDGFGTFSLGSQNFTVTDNMTKPNGVTCGSISSDSELIISCSVPAPEELGEELGKRSPTKRAALTNCFGDTSTTLDKVLQGFKSGASTPKVIQGVKKDEKVPDSKRSPPDCRAFTGAQRVGDGNPHQNPMNIQLSDPIHCENGGCSVGQTGSTSYTIGWSASKSTPWITAGFSVSKSISTGNSYTCSGGPHEVVALWRNQAQTAYTVQPYFADTCGKFVPLGNAIIWSPNANGRGSYYYCVRGAGYVRNRGDRWLDTNPNHPGGPP